MTLNTGTQHDIETKGIKKKSSPEVLSGRSILGGSIQKRHSLARSKRNKWFLFH